VRAAAAAATGSEPPAGRSVCSTPGPVLKTYSTVWEVLWVTTNTPARAESTNGVGAIMTYDTHGCLPLSTA
jgi:hypothetical protein